MPDASYDIGPALTRRILDRLGRESGHVQVIEREWDFGGGCTTCSSPESGFQVLVDGDQVWPSAEYLDRFGGVVFADSDGHATSSKLTVYGQFDNWLQGKPFSYDD